MANQSFEGNTPWPVSGSSNPRAGSSKSDAFSNDTAWGGLAGNQHVSQHLDHYTENLPKSPAGGAPVYENEFVHGHRWTEAEGKVHPGTGSGNMGW